MGEIIDLTAIINEYQEIDILTAKIEGLLQYLFEEKDLLDIDIEAVNACLDNVSNSHYIKKSNQICTSLYSVLLRLNQQRDNLIKEIAYLENQLNDLYENKNNVIQKNKKFQQN